MKTALAVIVLGAFVALTAGYIPPPDRWDKLGGQLEESQQLEERGKADVEEVNAMPEAQNYNSVGVKPHWCICCCWGCCRRRGKRSITSVGAPQTDRIIVLGSEKELQLYEAADQLRELEDTEVIRADLYERPLQSDVPMSVSAALRGKQYGVMITLDDGRRFMAVKGNQLGRGRETTLITADHVSDDWKKVSSKQIERSTVIDYVKAGGYSYDPLKDNGRHAAQRMMALD